MLDCTEQPSVTPELFTDQAIRKRSESVTVYISYGENRNTCTKVQYHQESTMTGAEDKSSTKSQKVQVGRRLGLYRWLIHRTFTQLPGFESWGKPLVNDLCFKEALTLNIVIFTGRQRPNTTDLWVYYLIRCEIVSHGDKGITNNIHSSMNTFFVNHLMQ